LKKVYVCLGIKIANPYDGRGMYVMKGENMSPFIRENSDKPARLLARTFFKELRANGYTHEQILLFSSEMIDCLNKELDNRSQHRN